MHTVEKIGGTSMSRFDDVLENIIIGKRRADELYSRVFVVSAYGGITNMLLEHKKTGEPGIYAYFAQGDERWETALTKIKTEMCKINASFAGLGLDVAAADTFVDERLEGIRNCLHDLARICSYGHFNLNDHLISIREMLAAVGEAHSAWNSVNILQKRGVNAVLVDLSGWMDTLHLNLDDAIRHAFAEIDFQQSLPIATGYTKCAEGIMTTFDRGYSEITFSKITVLTHAGEGIIHKEFHLSSGDPKLIGTDKVKIIGMTNYDVADQLADMGMEAIHPRAAKGMEMAGIPLRVKNTFEPDHPGTLISRDYINEQPRVEMVTGRKDLLAIEMVDPDMVGQPGYDYRILESFNRNKISYVAKNTNANTITHYIPEGVGNLRECIDDLKTSFPGACIRETDVAIVCVIGSNMAVPGFLSKASQALAEAEINILAMDQCMRQVNMQFILDRNYFEGAIKALHRGLVEA